MDSPNMQRISLYLSKEMVRQADRLKKKYHFSSRNEFFARAVENFIADELLNDDTAGRCITTKLAQAVKDLSEDNAKAISKGLFRYAVQLEMLMRMIATLSEIDDDEVEKMRREAINNVRRTRGKVSLAEIITGYYNE